MIVFDISDNIVCLRLIQDGFGHVDCKLNCIENVDPATTTTVSTTPQSTTTTIENRGAFNNYVDQILPNFDPLPRNCGHFTAYLLFVHVTKRGLFTDHLSTSSCSRNY